MMKDQISCYGYVSQPGVQSEIGGLEKEIECLTKVVDEVYGHLIPVMVDRGEETKLISEELEQPRLMSDIASQILACCKRVSTERKNLERLIGHLDI